MPTFYMDLWRAGLFLKPCRRSHSAARTRGDGFGCGSNRAHPNHKNAQLEFEKLLSSWPVDGNSKSLHSLGYLSGKGVVDSLIRSGGSAASSQSALLTQ
jgi:hypothetical protein